ncbi:MAG: hypothetical protein JXQ73_26365 [Phycisphaerae bacterium]|nr:hypothetical protein [Phycisphaerae bacterium]
MTLIPRRPPASSKTSLGRPRKQRGVFAVEMATAISLAVVIMGVLFEASSGYVRARERLMIDRQLRAAAESQLERYRAGARLDAPPPPGLLPNRGTLATTTAPGTGPWSGMTKVTVTASIVRRERGKPRQYNVLLSGYFQEAPKP